MFKKDRMKQKIEKYAGIIFDYNEKKISFEKDKNNNTYIIKCDDKKYIFKTYQEAIKFNVIKSPFNQWLTLKDINKIMEHSDKIHRIELKNLTEGKNVFIDSEDDLMN